MQSQVIAPLDGSTSAEAILPHALFFAQQTKGVLTLLRVIMPPGEPEYQVPYIPDDWYEGEISWTHSYLTGLATRLDAQGVRVQTQHLEGTLAGAAITSYAQLHPDVQLIAIATHGRSAGGRLLLGSVAGDVYASAPASMLILHPLKGAHLPPGPITPASYQTIIVPFDSSVGSERAIEQATSLAPASNASVLLLPVLPTYLLKQDIVVDELVEPLQRVPAHEEMKQADFLADQAERLCTSTRLTVETAVAEDDPAVFIERLFGKISKICSL